MMPEITVVLCVVALFLMIWIIYDVFDKPNIFNTMPSEAEKMGLIKGEKKKNG